MGWIIALAVLTAIALIPLGVSVVYDADGLVVKVIGGPIKIRVYPARKAPKDAPSEENVPAKEAAASPATRQPDKKTGQDEAPPEENSGSLNDFLSLARTGLAFLNDLRRKLRVDRLELKVIMAGSDPCDLAVNYGRAWAGVGNLWPQLERSLKIRKRDVQIECDFTADEPRLWLRLDITITFGRLLALAARYGFKAMPQLLKLMKSKKGGV